MFAHTTDLVLPKILSNPSLAAAAGLEARCNSGILCHSNGKLSAHSWFCSFSFLALFFQWKFYHVLLILENKFAQKKQKEEWLRDVEILWFIRGLGKSYVSSLERVIKKIKCGRDKDKEGWGQLTKIDSLFARAPPLLHCPVHYPSIPTTLPHHYHITLSYTSTTCHSPLVHTPQQMHLGPAIQDNLME